MITVPVTCTASDQNGNPVAGARVTAKLNQTEIYLGHIVPESITALADANGIAILNLWPNALGTQGSMYRVTATSPDTGRKYLDAMVSVPNSACNLHQIMTTAPYPAIDASAQALAAAQGALALVTAQAGIATTQASAASISAGNASTSATNAASSATAASGSAAAALASANGASSSAATAATQAGISTTKAGEAAASAGTANTQAGIATTQAALATTNGQSQVALAAAQVALATTQAGNAVGSANAANASANAASNSNTSAGNSATASANSAAASAASAITATAQAESSAGAAIASANSAAASLAIYGNTTIMEAAVSSTASNAAIASAQNTDSGVSAAASAASALAAATARDLSIAAWAASTAPTETLAAISRSIHSGTVVKSIIYDLSRGSDGGAFRKRCADKSWSIEALGGSRWIGQRASNSAAWTAAGSAVGAVYQSSADGKYYTPLSSTTQTEVFRGVARDFPEQLAIVAEVGRVVFYDLTVPNPAMWRVFLVAAANPVFAAPTSIAAAEGQILIGTASGAVALNFVSDTAVKYTTAADSRYKGRIADAGAGWN